MLEIIIIGLIIYFCVKKSPNRNTKRNRKEKEFTSEWTWDEGQQLWVHKSEYAKRTRVNRDNLTYEEWKAQHTSPKTEDYYKVFYPKPKNQHTKTNGNYHYKGNDIPQSIIEKPKHVHYQSMNQSTGQQTEPIISINIPENIQELIKEAKKEATPPKDVTKKLSQEQIDSINRYKASFQEPRVSQPIRPPEVKSKTTQTPVYHTSPAPEPAKTKEKSEFQDVYKAVPILTKNEMNNYRTLQEAAMKKGYIINIKPRLADIIAPAMSRKDPRYQANFHRISQKHVDFVVLDMNMKIKAVIELDDSSHDRKDRKERDKFVDEILENCGYKIIHTRYIWPDILDNI